MVAKKRGAMKNLIKSVRSELGMTRAEFAEYIGCSNIAVLQRWEGATASPGGLMTARLIEAGVSVQDLIKAFEEDASQS